MLCRLLRGRGHARHLWHSRQPLRCLGKNRSTQTGNRDCEKNTPCTAGRHAQMGSREVQGRLSSMAAQVSARTDVYRIVKKSK
jgi:hypothetical protein